MGKGWASRFGWAVRGVAALAAAGVLAAGGTAPTPAAATTVKHVEKWTLPFAPGSADLTPRHRLELVRAAESMERRCLPPPAGGALWVVGSVEPEGGLDEAGRRVALERIANVRGALARLTPPSTVLVEDLVTARQWQSQQAAVRGAARRPPPAATVTAELACDPRP